MHRMRLVIVGDFGKDLDDEGTLVLQDGERRHRRSALVRPRGSRRQDPFELLAVVANLAPPLQRARLAKGTLKQLGQSHVPVGIGSDCGNAATGHDHEFAGVPYLATDRELVHDGTELLVRTLRSAKNGSVTLVLISGLTDIATLLRCHGDLVRDKVCSVAIMGGVKQANDAVAINAEGFMEPDTAANNEFDMPAAEFCYRRIQELGVPMVILTQEAAYACKVPRDIYDKMAATGHPVGIKLRDSQKNLIEDLWRRACMRKNARARGKLPNRCDKTWFCNTFCAGQGLDRTGKDSIWDLVQSVNLYDPMTLVAAVPDLRERFYQPTNVQVKGVNHLIIGVSEAVHGVKDTTGLATFMTERFVKALTESLPDARSRQRRAAAAA